MVRKTAPTPDSSGIPGGVLPDGGGQPAFTLSQARAATIPVLIAVPHAGRSYPAPLLAAMRHAHAAPLRLEDRLVDLNRAPEDMDWDMVAGSPPPGTLRHAAGRRARSGLGLVPRRLQGLGELWRERLPVDELQARIELVHCPYHRALGQTLEDLRDRWGAALLVDLHSMPPLGPKTGRDPAADFVIGDRYGSACAAGLTQVASDHFARTGWRAAHNRPYAGGYVLDRHGAPQRRLHAMQIEVCRAVYLDPSLRQPGDGLEPVATVLAGLVRRLAEELVGPAQSLAQAAE